MRNFIKKHNSLPQTSKLSLLCPSKNKKTSQTYVRSMFTRRLNRLFFGTTASTLIKMEAKLEAIPLVDIDPEGIFKYILIKVYGPVKDGVEPSKHIVRGYRRAEWHNDIYEEVAPGIQGLGLDTECIGGGRIEHLPEKKKLKVYGYSTGFGKADHSISREVLKTKYSNYDIEISDEGY